MIGDILVSFAAGLWLYSTFDNVDGKQARRTGTSSPLGELFDHGCDALNTSFAALLQAAALGMGHSTASVMLYGIAMFGFYLSTAEEYHTGTLYLGYVNAPTEGVLVSCFVFCLSGYYGELQKDGEKYIMSYTNNIHVLIQVHPYGKPHWVKSFQLVYPCHQPFQPCLQVTL